MSPLLPPRRSFNPLQQRAQWAHDQDEPGCPAGVTFTHSIRIEARNVAVYRCPLTRRPYVALTDRM